jgi:CubicO group peptidase (beta-lactamase class C family)
MAQLTERRRPAVRLRAVGLVTVAVLAVTGIGCSAEDASSDPDTTTGTAAPSSAADNDETAGRFPGETWTVETPESHGMDPALLDQALLYAAADGRNTQSVVVVHDGVIVAEWYAPDADEASWAASWSVAKSVTSALIGIAIDDGLIPGVDEPMTTYFPEWEGTTLAQITLRDVLQMESGRAWDEDYDPTSFESSEVIAMGLTELDQLVFAAAQPMADGPAAFNYSSGDTMLLSGVIEQATGLSAAEYAQEELFGPLDIDQVEWWQDAAGHTLTYCCLDTTSRDFARFGLLYLRDGVWGDEQVVPSQWVDDSVTDTASTYDSYGYQWWLSDDEEEAAGIDPYFAALGHDGQYVYVFPDHDLVVVRNGTYARTDCEPVADPNLFGCYPPSGIVPGQGTVAPDEWDDAAFLMPILESLSTDP